MINLPLWRLTNKFPAFYDSESGSAIEQTAKVYGAMRSLIEEHNHLMSDLQKALNDFEGETKEDIDRFKECVTTTIENYITMIDTKMTQFDSVVDKALENFDDNAKEILNEALSNGSITITESYDDTTESLNFVLGGNV